MAFDRSQARVFLDKGKELYRSDHDSEAAEAFEQAVNAAKTGCPVSKVLNAKITLNAKLVSAAGVAG